jgi:hypothetical protein
MHRLNLKDNNAQALFDGTCIRARLLRGTGGLASDALVLATVSSVQVC